MSKAIEDIGTIGNLMWKRGDRVAKESIPPAARRAAVAAFAGSFIEFYDYSVFHVLLVYFSPLFFPGTNHNASLLAGLAVYGVGFIGRPLGGILFGRIGDLRGRRAALMMTIGLMGLCTALIGLLPSHAAIGLAAPVLLVILRFGQGLSAGSEIMGSVTLVIETAPASRRGFLASMTPLGMASGALFGSAIAASASALLSPTEMHSYGWRIAFLLVVPLTLIAFLLRRRVEDSPEFAELARSHHTAKAPLREALIPNWRQMLLASAVAITVNGPASAATFFIPYLVGTRGLSFAAVAMVNSIACAITLLAPPVAGLMTDRLGNRSMLALVFAAFFVLAFPIMWLIGTTDNLLVLGLILTLNLALSQFIAVPAWSYIAALFPANVRYTGSTLAANVGSVLVGSSGGFAVAALVFGTGSPLGATIWISGWSLAGLVVLALSRGFARRLAYAADGARHRFSDPNPGSH